MKKILLSLVCFLPFTSQAAEPCVAFQVSDISYGSKMYYSVVCGKDTFETKANITTALLPIPYKWSKVAKKNLDKDMSARGYQEVAQFDKTTIENKRIEVPRMSIFEKSPSDASYCVVMKYNVKAGTGISQRNELFDASIFCTTDTAPILYKGVTDVEVQQAMQAKGNFSKLFDGKPKKSYFDGGFSLYRNR